MFLTTHWSLVIDVRGADPRAAAALETLCRAYRRPVIAFLRQRGYGREDAEDIAQAFFVELLERRVLERADRERGRFRTFLLGALRHHLGNLRDHAGAAKRGGGVAHETLHDGDDEGTGQAVADDVQRSPESAFDHAWALTVLDRALARMRTEAEASGKLPLFETLRPFVLEPVERDEFRDLSGVLDMRPNTIAVVVRRLRARFRELIEAELAQTVSNTGDLEAELGLLRQALRGTH